MTLQGSVAFHGNKAHWTETALRAFLQRTEQTGETDLPLLGVGLHEGVRQRGDNDGRPAASEDLSGYKIVREGDVIMNRLGKPHGSVGVSPVPGITSPAYWVLEIDRGRAYPAFVHHLLRSKHLVREYERLGKYMPPNQFDISWDTFRSIEVPLPPLGEQRRIALFLDAETARIDGLAAARRRMRDLLTLRRERTVERLLGLDALPPMIPLKYAVQTVSVGIVITPANWYVDEGGIRALRGINIQPGRIEGSNLVQISREGHRENMKSRLSAGDVVVVRTGQAGAAAVVPDELDGCNCIDLLIIRPGRRTSASFLAHYLNSFYAQDKISEHSVGSLQAHFNVASMKNLNFPNINLAEQQRRVAELADVLEELDLLNSRLDAQLELLAERRQALVTAAVTGGITV